MMRKTGLQNNESGFTLIELMVVVGIIALVSGMVVPSIGSYFQISLNSTTRNLANTIKETYNSTVVTGNVHRLVYDFKDKKYWVEVGPPTALLDTKESREKEEQRKRRSHSADSEQDDKGASNGFALAKSITRKKQSLPTGVEFEDILTQLGPDPVTEGTAYTHFFPNGLTEQTVVRLKDTSEHHASLVISPLLGRTDVYDRYLKPEELKGPGGTR